MTINDLLDIVSHSGEVFVIDMPPPASRGKRIRLCRFNGPFGVVLRVNRGCTIAEFKSHAIRKWCLNEIDNDENPDADIYCL